MIQDAYVLANSPNPWLKVIGGSMLIGSLLRPLQKVSKQLIQQHQIDNITLLRRKENGKTQKLE